VNTAQNGLFEILPEFPRDQVQQIVAGTASEILTMVASGVRDRAIDAIVVGYNNVYVTPLSSSPALTGEMRSP
jgi:hypothetical protein